MELPSRNDFDPNGSDLDAQCALRNFGGLTLEEAFRKFETCPQRYQEDFMFMGTRAFAFYYPVIDRFLRKSVELSPADRGDRQSWILPQCIKTQFEHGKQATDHLRKPVLELCDFMLKNLPCFVSDWDDPSEIEKQWQSLREFILRLT